MLPRASSRYVPLNDMPVFIFGRLANSCTSTVTSCPLFVPLKALLYPNGPPSTKIPSSLPVRSFQTTRPRLPTISTRYEHSLPLLLRSTMKMPRPQKLASSAAFSGGIQGTTPPSVAALSLNRLSSVTLALTMVLRLTSPRGRRPSRCKSHRLSISNVPTDPLGLVGGLTQQGRLLARRPHRSRTPKTNWQSLSLERPGRPRLIPHPHKR